MYWCPPSLVFTLDMGSGGTMTKANLLGLLFILFSTGIAYSAPEELIPLDTPWKIAIHNFAIAHLQHSAWGVAHSERDYLLSVELAEKDGLAVDRDVLFAAAYLH